MSRRKRPTDDAPDAGPISDFAPDDEPAHEGDVALVAESKPPQIAARDEEIARLRVRVAELEAGAAVWAAKKYTVSIPDGPTAVVAPEPGEHPFDAFKRATGVLATPHAPQISPAGDDVECGIYEAGKRKYQSA